MGIPDTTHTMDIKINVLNKKQLKELDKDLDLILEKCKKLHEFGVIEKKKWFQFWK